MSEQLARLMNPPTAAQVRDKLLAQLKGIGWTLHSGSSPGSLTATGVPIITALVAVKIIAAGDLGTATFQYSLDGGVTYSSTQTVPSNGVFAAAFATATGCSLAFGNGVVGTPTGGSFIVGDVFQLQLTINGFPVTAWQPLSVALSMVENDAEALADLYQLVMLIARGGLTAYATGDWLDLVASQFYSLSRIKGIPTKGTVRLVDAGGTGPYTQPAGGVIVATDGGLRFINDTTWTLAHNGTQNVPFTAESAGSVYNVGNNVIDLLSSPTMAGVVVSNPDPGSGSWITQNGTDDETDQQLAQRCAARWPSLGTGSPTSTYDTFAKQASTSVTKTASFIDQTVPGQVDLYLAGLAGGVSGGVVTAVQAYINPRAPITVTVVAASAAPAALVVSGVVYVAAGFLEQATGEINANLTKLIANTQIGGIIYLTAVIDAIQRGTGVRNVVLTGPMIDTLLTPTQVATLTNSLTFTAI